MMNPSSLLRAMGAMLVLAAGRATAQDSENRTVRGTIADSAGRPIPYVSIDGGPRYRTLTNASGEFTMLVLRKDAFEVAVRRIGYLPAQFKVEAGGDTSVSVSMQQLGVMLTAQVVRARQLVTTLEYRGFYDRMLQRERGALVGEFITPEEIEMRNPQRVTQLLEQRRGINVRRMPGCINTATCYVIRGQGNCAATVYLDGQRLNRLAEAAASSSGAPMVDELIPVTGVSAIEVYPRGSSAPAKYQSFSGTCAIVVIWTK